MAEARNEGRDQEDGENRQGKYDEAAVALAVTAVVQRVAYRDGEGIGGRSGVEEESGPAGNTKAAEGLPEMAREERGKEEQDDAEAE